MSVLRRGLATWALARHGVSIVALSAATSAALAAPPLYRITELPDVGTAMPVAVALNDQGVIAGTLFPVGGNRRAFRWHEGRPIEFAPLDDSHHEQATVALDEQGAMAYWVEWPGNGLPGKFLRTEVWGRRAAPAKKLRGVFSFFGNAAGDLIIDGDQRVYALRERDGTVTDMGRRDDNVELNDLNNLKQAVGHRRPGRPVLWTRGAGYTDIPALPDEPLVSAQAINDQGDVVLMTGPFELSRDGPDNAPNAIYVWNADQGTQPLSASADCAWYQPRKLNAGGTVVGHCYASPSPLSAQHAFAADADNGIYLLESRIDPADPNAARFNMLNAIGINRSGQIAVEALDRIDPGQKVLLLTPVR